MLIQLLKHFRGKGSDRLKKIGLFFWEEHEGKHLFSPSTTEHANSTLSDSNAESVLAWDAAWSTQFLLIPNKLDGSRQEFCEQIHSAQLIKIALIE